jgi:HD-GYP domain-containing protein (c-di-GMP phosphodiesterase class II)
METITLQNFGEFQVETHEDLKRLREIETQVLNELNLGFSPEVISILDNEDARQEDIEKIKLKLRQDVLSRLIGRANLVSHLGKAKAGEANEFLNVVMRLGMKPAKVYILAFSLYFSSHELEELAASSFSMAIIGRILARQLGLTTLDQDRVELGALLLEMGKIPMILYEKQNRLKLDGDFTSRYHPYFGVRMIQKYALPYYLAGVILNQHFSIDRNGFSVTAVVDLAHCVVERSFMRSGKFVVQSQAPGDQTDSNLLASINSAFQVIGLRKYLEIKAPPNPAR